MTPYRSRATILAVQYKGEPIPDVTCNGDIDNGDREKNGCDANRAHLTHVHTRSVGGMTVLKPGDWIMPSVGGPFAVAEDAEFRRHYEVPLEVVPMTGPIVAGKPTYRSDGSPIK